MKDDDYMKILGNTHDMLLIFTTHGKLYWKKVYELPLVSRQAKGKPIVNFLNLDEETISAILPIQEFCDVASVMMATKGGRLKLRCHSFHAPGPMASLPLILLMVTPC